MFKFFQKNRSKKTMENETKNEQMVEQKETESPKEEVKDEKVEEKTEVKDEKIDKKEENVPAEQENNAPQVNSVMEAQEPNAIRVEDLVTKSDLQEMISALNAKLDALVKENSDLKDKNAEMSNKYEGHDFGNETKKGFGEGNKQVPYESFEEYSKQFK